MSSNSNSRVRLRHQVMSHYSGGEPKCECCGESFLEFLVIDHIEGAGAAHRKEIGGGGIKLYRWLKVNAFPSGFRVLCHNCNSSIAQWGYCPHVDERRLRPAITIADSTRRNILAAAKAVFNSGLYPTMGRVSEIAGVSKQAVVKYRRLLAKDGEWPCPLQPCVKNGALHWNVILTVDDVKKIRIMLADGIKNTQIAKQFSVSRHTISDIKNRRSWKNI